MYRYLLIVSLFFIICCKGNNANAVKQKENIKQSNSYFGNWKITSHTNVDASIMSETRAFELTNDIIIIDKEKFLMRGTVITNPIYKIKTETAESRKENYDFPTQDSYFYGYKKDRKEINFIEVYKNEDMYFKLEYINNNELIYYLDGRLFFLNKK